jgi:hydroxymethylbilane synthase
MKSVVLGSRGSRLALTQTEMTITALKDAFPGLEAAIEVIHTKGDKILDVPLALVGGKGLFVKEIEEALLDGRCDMAVHSLKDVPAELPDGLILGAALIREVPFDALVSSRYGTVGDLPEGARVGTSSLRRACQIREIRPDVEAVSLRGNVETRLRKLVDEGLDAIILAAAGLRRLGLSDQIASLLSPPEFIPAVGQGIVVVECREDDTATRGLLAALEHHETRLAMRAEREFLAVMGGGCQVPLGAYATIDGATLLIQGMVGRPDGSQLLRHRVSGTVDSPEAAGRELAEHLLDAGGRAILDELVPV